MKKKMLIYAKIFVSSIAFVFSACSEEQPLSEVEARVETDFSLRNSSAMEGKITIQQAYLKLDYIRVIGNAADRVTNILHDVSAHEPPYQLAHPDSTHLEFTLPAYPYEQLNFHLFLYADAYPLAFTTSPVEQIPEPAQGEDSPIPGPTAESENNAQGDSDAGEPDDKPGNPDDHGDEDDHDGGHHDGEDGDSDEEEDDEDEGGHKGDGDDKHGGKDKDDKKKKDKDHKKGKDDKKTEKDKDKGKGKKDNKNNDNKPGYDGRADIDSEVVDLDGFFQNARPALVVFATYENENSTIRLIFAATDVEKLSLHAQQNDGSPILLGPDNTAKISFDASQWFDSIRPTDIEAGSMQLYQGQEVLFIHKDYNTALYEAIVSRIEPSADLLISPKDGM